MTQRKIRVLHTVDRVIAGKGYYKEGEIMETSANDAAELVLDGRAEYVDGLPPDEYIKPSYLILDQKKKPENGSVCNGGGGRGAGGAFKTKHEEWKTVQAINCTDIDSLYKEIQIWLYLEDKEFVEIIQVAVLDREIDGDPVWLYVIGAPGSCKTELLNAESKGYSKAFSLDTLTTATLVSGIAEKDKDSGEYRPIAGIMQDLDGKCLIIKDFTTILSMNQDSRTEIYGQLRAAYDGYFEKAFGTMREPVRVKAKFGLLAGVTPIIDKYTALQGVLGERFLKVRHEPNKLESTRRALLNEGHEEIMRLSLAKAVETFIKSRKFVEVTISEEIEMWILKLAFYTAYLRANVWASYDEQGRVIDAWINSVEVPTRIAKQFKHFIKLLAIIRGRNYATIEDLKIIQRVARDTACAKKQAIIDFMWKNGKNRHYKVADIAGSVKNLYRASAPNHLGILESLDVLSMNDDGDYAISQDFLEYAEALYTLPPASLQNKPENAPISEPKSGDVNDANSSKPSKEPVQPVHTSGSGLIDTCIRILETNENSMGIGLFNQQIMKLGLEPNKVRYILKDDPKFIFTPLSISFRDSDTSDTHESVDPGPEPAGEDEEADGE